MDNSKITYFGESTDGLKNNKKIDDLNYENTKLSNNKLSKITSNEIDYTKNKIRCIGLTIEEFYIEVPEKLELEYSKIAEIFLKHIKKDKYNSITEYIIKALNKISEKTLNLLSVSLKFKTQKFDELVIFKLDNSNIDSFSLPIFIYGERNEVQSLQSYADDGQRLIQRFKRKYIDGDKIFNEAILIDDAYGTEFDIMVILDIGYIIFYNNLRMNINIKDFEKMKSPLNDSIFLFRSILSEYNSFNINNNLKNE